MNNHSLGTSEKNRLTANNSDSTGGRASCKTTCGVRRLVRPPLTPIPVAGPFDHVGVDIAQLITTRRGIKYAIVFMDYLTKWPEVFTTPNQASPSDAKIFVEHSIPHQLLSYRGPSFLSKFFPDVSALLGTKKISAYHPQTNGLVELFHRSLIDMLARTVGRQGWDEVLLYVLFAYRSTKNVQQESHHSTYSIEEIMICQQKWC